MTAVADPYERDDNDVSIVPGLGDATELDDGVTEEEDADIYTQTVKAPGVGNDDGTSLGDESTPVTPPGGERARGNLDHGLGNPGGSTHDATLEEGTEFGLGSDNTQDTAPVPEAVEPDPLRHGLGQADEDAVE